MLKRFLTRGRLSNCRFAAATCALVLISVLSATSTLNLLAQQPTGKITGVVTDSASAAVPGALIRITNTRTMVVQEATSNSTGLYVLAPVAVGDYTLEVTKQGFDKIVRPAVHIDVDAAETVNFALSVGAITQTVTVQSGVSTINTQNQELGNLRLAEQWANVPIAVREVGTLAAQSAGIPYGSTDTVGGTYNQGDRSFMQVVANGVQQNPFQTSAYPAIDGLGRRADLTMPNTDTISEMRMITNGSSAEYSAPTAMVVATKSGTNQFHGGLYEFYESGGLSATTWGVPTPPSFVRHQYGGTVGGPIKKDKMFFFGGVDVYSYQEALTTPVRYPTAAERSGELSDLLTRTVGGQPAPIILNNPLTGQPFPGNIIPPGMINPVSQALLETIPTGPSTPEDDLGAFNSTFTKPLFDDSEKYDMRYDYDPNASNQFNVTATIAHLNQLSRFEGSVPGLQGSLGKNEWTQVIAGTWTRDINASTFTTLSASWRNEPFNNHPALGNTPFSVPILDIPQTPGWLGPPSTTIGSNGGGISDLFSKLYFNGATSTDHDYEISPIITKTFRRHTFKAGFVFVHGIKTLGFAGPPYGQYNTVSDFNNASSTVSASGDAFADFLLGYPSSTTISIPPVGAALRKTNYAFFFEDSWNVTQKLTLDLGLRYDNFGMFFPTNLLMASGNVATGQIVIPSGSANLVSPAFQPYSSLFVQANQLGVPNSLVKSNNLDFSPRFGFAYRIQPTLVVRGGFGIYSNDLTENQISSALNSPPFIYQAQLSRSLLQSQGVDVNSLYTFQNPTAGGSTASAAGAIAGVAGMSRDYPTQKAYTWNLIVEKQLGYQIVVRASTTGTLGRQLSLLVDLNACVPGPVTCLQRAPTDPTARRWQDFGLSFGSSAAGGNSTYNAGDVEVSKHFSNGLLFDANYSYSRLFSLGYLSASGGTPTISNPFASTREYDYGPNGVEPYNIFHLSYVYLLPLGRGQHFGTTMSRLADSFLGGWQISGLGTWESGVPLTVTAGTGQTPTGVDTVGGVLRANRIGNGTLSHSGQTRIQKAQKWFDTSAYTVPALIDPTVSHPTNQFGTAGIGTVIGPRFSEYDMTLQKTIQIRESLKLQLRVDAFDLFNIPMLGTPNTIASSPTFGQILTANSTSVQSGPQSGYIPRTFQLGIRLNF